MSAAEPTRATDEVSTSEVGAIIDLSTHPAWARDRYRGERHISAAPEGPEQMLAEWVEGLFLKERFTLTDDDTAEKYRITLRAVRVMVEGVLKQGVIDEEQHAVLAGMLDDMKDAPSRL